MNMITTLGVFAEAMPVKKSKRKFATLCIMDSVWIMDELNAIQTLIRNATVEHPEC
tara:strand:+ start:1027 stop:1194 length:168 start_codon:yes stop_codon:yes gene_type:complete